MQAGCYWCQIPKIFSCCFPLCRIFKILKKNKKKKNHQRNSSLSDQLKPFLVFLRLSVHGIKELLLYRESGFAGLSFAYLPIVDLAHRREFRSGSCQEALIRKIELIPGESLFGDGVSHIARDLYDGASCDP